MRKAFILERVYQLTRSWLQYFLQLRISERSGRGVPKIVSKYGRDSIKIEKNRITVIIPLNKLNVVSFEVDNKVDDKKIKQHSQKDNQPN